MASPLIVQSAKADTVLQSQACSYYDFNTIKSAELYDELMPSLPMACDLKPKGWEPLYARRK